MASITLYVPEQEPLELALDGYEQITIGRGPDNDVVLDHVSMSGSHAVIQNLEGTFQVNDLGSTNGTFVNGDQITEAVLSHGTRIMFGNVDAVFSDEASAAAGGDEANADAGVAAGAGYGA
ncbi:MAG: FHA domain-containing protein, partial [Verrucomicrobiota bacterium]